MSRRKSPTMLTEAMRKPRRQRAMVTDKQVAAYDATDERIMKVATAENIRLTTAEKKLHDEITAELRKAREAAGE